MGSENLKYLGLVTGKGTWHTDDCNESFKSLHLSDGPHGLRKQEENAKTNNDSYVSTCYPTASCLAASWDTELLREVGESLGQEAKAAEVDILLGPGVNMKRSPLCGRNFEYFSEDPYLAGVLGTAYVNGVQSKGVGTSLKHFACNNQETKRMTSNSRVDERTLREYYLAAFERIVKNAQPATIMASYNYLNGIHATENSHLLKDILRDEWGYKGVVVSDWGACMDLTKAVPCGMDLEMPSSSGNHINKLKEALENGTVKEEEITPAIERMKKLVTGEWINDSKQLIDDYYGDLNREIVHYAREIAYKAAVSGAVLLKNDNNVLPVSTSEYTDIIVIGELAHTMRFQGGGSSHIKTAEFPNAIESLENNGYTVKFIKGYRTETEEIDKKLEELCLSELQTLFDSQNGLYTPVLFFGGLTDITEGEGYDRSDLQMPKNQKHLFDEIYKIAGPVHYISFGGSPYILPDDEKCSSILHMYLAGESAGEAVADIISGKVNPSGHLAETFPNDICDTPAYGSFAGEKKEIYYKEGILAGYRHYDTNGIKTRYPFGYGLSYTTFELKGTDDPYTVICTNTGDREGKCVIQAYIETPDNPVFIRAKHELAGFKKVLLKPGESAEVKFDIEDRAFMVFDTEKNAFVTAGGEYGICFGLNVENLSVKNKLYVKGELYDSEQSAKGLKLDRFVGNNESNLDKIKPGGYSVYNSLSELAEASPLARLVKNVICKVIYLMYPGKAHNDPEVLMTLSVILDGPIDCLVCQSRGMLKYSFAERLVRQANRKK